MKSYDFVPVRNKYPEVRREFVETLDWMGMERSRRGLLLELFELAYSAGKCDAADELLKDYRGKRTYEAETANEGQRSLSPA